MEVGSYSSVPQDDSQNLQDGLHIFRPSRRHFVLTFLLPFFTLFVGLFSGMLIDEHWKRDFKSYGSYETGFHTESVLPPNLIELEQKRFGGNVKFLSNGTEVLILDPLEPVYVGNPHPDIDLAWDKLLKGRYFSLSEEEAKKVWGPGYKVYMDQAEGGFTGGFDVFHSLHCLNQIRQALYPDYYHPTVFHGIEHTHHCINHIRQTLQCSSTATLIPSSYRENIKHQYVDSAQVHTCRKFENLRKYTWERFNGSLVVPRPTKVAGTG